MAALVLPELPYAKDALQPYMSAETFDYHHGKHHNAYVVNGNKLLEGTDLESKSVEEIVQAVHGDASKAGIFNNAAQVWNHSEFWKSMKPNGGGALPGELESRMNDSFGSLDAFKEAFTQAAVTQFGSGWAWLTVGSDGKLEIVKTANADTPMATGGHTLICCDVWEHAYYIDYRNARPDFVKAFLDNLVNWEYAAERLAAAG